MDKFLHFVENHWLMWLGLVAVLILLIFEELKEKVFGVKSLSPTEVTQLINRDEAVVIDLRDSQSFARGHIIDAINLMPNELEANAGKLEKYKNKTIILVDANTQNSAAAAKLNKMGFEKVYSLAGGINSWRNLGLPVIKK